jgi:hypothetical protein
MHEFTRQELYDLVWSEPITKLAKRFGFSDVWVHKACRRNDIPTPGVGYWAKLEAGKTLVRVPLPPRGHGKPDRVTLGQDRWNWYRRPPVEVLAAPLPRAPVFQESLEEVTERARRIVGSQAISRSLETPHPEIAKLLQEDERRREAQRASKFLSSWNAPLFDTPFEQRRLRILNGLFGALARCGGRASIRDKEAREIYVSVGEEHLSIKLQAEEETRKRPPARHEIKATAKLILTIPHMEGEAFAGITGRWEDASGNRIGSRLKDIVVGILVAAEFAYRAGEEHRYKRALKDRAEAEETLRKEAEEAARKLREARRAYEAELRKRILTDAAAWRQAIDIRTYVQAVVAQAESRGDPSDPHVVNAWQAYALAEADRIDPLRRPDGGSFPIEAFNLPVT